MAIKFQEKSGSVEVATKTIVTLDYTELNDKPIINEVELVGSLSLDDLGIQPKGEYVQAKDLHTHNNKSILDTITQDDINKWNAAEGGGGSDVDLTDYAKKEDYYTKAEIDAMLVNGDEVSY
jgi:hypothetical protein